MNDATDSGLPSHIFGNTLFTTHRTDGSGPTSGLHFRVKRGHHTEELDLLRTTRVREDTFRSLALSGR